MKVPTIDLEAAEHDVSMLAPLDAACRDHGFFLLNNHGMDDAIATMWQASQAFFSQPAEIKRQVMRTDAIPLGYFDRELTKRRRDQKEVFDFMRSRPDGSDVNQWPAAPSNFRHAMMAFFDSATRVAERTLSLVYRALSSTQGGADISMLPPGEARTSTVRLNYYPYEDPLTGAESEGIAPLGDMALHHHTDPGVLTLLLQDMTGGLQTLSRQDGWIDVPPRAGTIVVNLGDTLQVWTNDVYRAAVHRVVPMSQLEKGTAGRYSTPYFYNPKADAILEPQPALLSGEPVYRPFTWREYIRGRVDDNYTDLGEEDIQIDRFRLSA